MLTDASFAVVGLVGLAGLAIFVALGVFRQVRLTGSAVVLAEEYPESSWPKELEVWLNRAALGLSDEGLLTVVREKIPEAVKAQQSKHPIDSPEDASRVLGDPVRARKHYMSRFLTAEESRRLQELYPRSMRTNPPPRGTTVLYSIVAVTILLCVFAFDCRMTWEMKGLKHLADTHELIAPDWPPIVRACAKSVALRGGAVLLILFAGIRLEQYLMRRGRPVQALGISFVKLVTMICIVVLPSTIFGGFSAPLLVYGLMILEVSAASIIRLAWKLQRHPELAPGLEIGPSVTQAVS